MGFHQHLFDIPFLDIARIGLVETDLQLGTKLHFNQTLNFIPSDEHVHALRAFILNLHGATMAILNCLPLFFGEFGSHKPILPLD